jgi:hypothetical protein
VQLAAARAAPRGQQRGCKNQQFVFFSGRQFHGAPSGACRQVRKNGAKIPLGSHAAGDARWCPLSTFGCAIRVFLGVAHHGGDKRAGGELGLHLFGAMVTAWL